MVHQKYIPAADISNSSNVNLKAQMAKLFKYKLTATEKMKYILDVQVIYIRILRTYVLNSI